MRADYRQWVLKTQAELRLQLAANGPERGNLVVIPGMEYTDHRWGHGGIAFADVKEVLDEVPLDVARAHPERFFERWLAHGGVMTINHPVQRPMPAAPFMELRFDLSWRGFGRPIPDGYGRPRAVHPADVAFITQHAQTVETFNLSIGHLRDQFLVGDEDRSLREAAHLVDRVARDDQRRITPVGGSDSHGNWLRATTYVLARDRSAAGVREALLGGRTCVRGPEACSLRVKEASRSGQWQIAGDAIAHATAVDVITEGGPATFVVNGVAVAQAATGQPTRITLPDNRCALVRAIVGRSWSAPVYVNCAFADGMLGARSFFPSSLPMRSPYVGRDG